MQDLLFRGMQFNGGIANSCLDAMLTLGVRMKESTPDAGLWNTTTWGLRPCYSTSLLPFLLLPIHPTSCGQNIKIPGLPRVGVSDIKELPGGGWNPLAIHIMSVVAWKACHCTSTKWHNLEKVDPPPRDNGTPQHPKGEKGFLFHKNGSYTHGRFRYSWTMNLRGLESFLME